MDIKVYVDKLIKNGKTEEAATEIITDAIELMKSRHGDEATDEFITKHLNMVFDSVNTADGNSFKVTVLAYDKGFDINAKLRETAQSMLDVNYERAVLEGYVKVDVDKNTGEEIITLIDYRPTISFGGDERKNYSFGKELKPYIKRMVVGLNEEGELIKASIYSDEPPEIGHTYMVSGKVTDRGYYGNKRGVRDIGEVNENDLWHATMGACATSDLAIALVDAPAQENWSIFVTYGNVKKAFVTSNDSIMVVMTDENVHDGIVGFSASDRDPVVARQFDNINEVCEKLYEGSEAIIIAKGRTKDDGSFVMTIIGALQPYDAEEQNVTQNELARLITV